MNTATQKQDNVVLKVISQKDYDRVIFLTYTDAVLSGLNFHFSTDEVDYGFANPCKPLTDIFNKLSKGSNGLEMDRINHSLELYIDRFINHKNEPYSLNEYQRNLIKKALDYYVATSERFNQHPTQKEAYDIFDMMQLSPMMNYPVQVVISEQEKNEFSKHGIDFPIQ